MCGYECRLFREKRGKVGQTRRAGQGKYWVRCLFLRWAGVIHESKDEELDSCEYSPGHLLSSRGSRLLVVLRHPLPTSRLVGSPGWCVRDSAMMRSQRQAVCTRSPSSMRRRSTGETDPEARGGVRTARVFLGSWVRAGAGSAMGEPSGCRQGVLHRARVHCQRPSGGRAGASRLSPSLTLSLSPVPVRLCRGCPSLLAGSATDDDPRGPWRCDSART